MSQLSQTLLSDITLPLVHSNDQELTGLSATVQGDPITTPGLSATPVGRVDVYVNSLRYLVGDAAKTKGVYFSNDGGTTARAHSAIASGDTCHLGTMGATAGGIDTSDKISFAYSV